jgi:hypothetical protein
MNCEARQIPGRRRLPERLSLRFGTGSGLHEGSPHWQLRPRSRPHDDGSRRITIEARLDTKALVLDLSAGEAAELMFEIGAALEQAARDERSLAENAPTERQVSTTGRRKAEFG